MILIVVENFWSDAAKTNKQTKKSPQRHNPAAAKDQPKIHNGGNNKKKLKMIKKMGKKFECPKHKEDNNIKKIKGPI